VEGNQTADYPTKAYYPGPAFRWVPEVGHAIQRRRLPYHGMGALLFTTTMGLSALRRKVPNTTLGPNNLSFLCRILSYGIHPQYATWGIPLRRYLLRYVSSEVSMRSFGLDHRGCRMEAALGRRFKQWRGWLCTEPRSRKECRARSVLNTLPKLQLLLWVKPELRSILGTAQVLLIRGDSR
jgi:hypothetical protein